MLIHKALLKHGYSVFKLEILEYCEINNTIDREQYYINKLRPEYNILNYAASSLGFKHSEETKLKMSIKSLEHLEKIRNNLKNINSKPFSPEVRQKITDGMVKFYIETKSKKILFTNIETKEVLSFNSMRDAALEMKVSRNTITKYILNRKAYGKYKITLG
jgi:group I intron endonuclease